VLDVERLGQAARAEPVEQRAMLAQEAAEGRADQDRDRRRRRVAPELLQDRPARPLAGEQQVQDHQVGPGPPDERVRARGVPADLDGAARFLLEELPQQLEAGGVVVQDHDQRPARRFHRGPTSAGGRQGRGGGSYRARPAAASGAACPSPDPTPRPARARGPRRRARVPFRPGSGNDSPGARA
jgi:hypothetical protein